MALKKVVIILVAVVVLLSSGLYIITSSQFNIYTDAPHVKYDEVLDDQTSTIYYYYQDTCHFCNSIKEQVTDLYLATEDNPDINLVMVDVKSSLNADAWADDPAFSIENVDTGKAENIQITGTPTMIYVKNGELVEYEVGKDVFKLMENVNQEYNLGLTFDPSVYGQD